METHFRCNGYRMNMTFSLSKLLLSSNKQCMKHRTFLTRLLSSTNQHFHPNSSENAFDAPQQIRRSEENILRCKLAAVYRLIELHKWDSDIFNHITSRVPGQDDTILINPFGLLYNEITSSNLIKVKLDGSVVEQGTSRYGVNVAGLVLHSALHETRPDVNCILHFHQRHVQAVSSLDCGLLRICLDSCVLGNVSRHPFQGITIYEDEKEELSRNLGPANKVMLLDNHGAVICAETVEEAWMLAVTLVHSCKMQILALQAAGGDVNRIKLIDEETYQRTFDTAWSCNKGTDLTTSANRHGQRFGERMFQAHVHKLERMGITTGLLLNDHPSDT